VMFEFRKPPRRSDRWVQLTTDCVCSSTDYTSIYELYLYRFMAKDDHLIPTTRGRQEKSEKKKKREYEDFYGSYCDLDYQTSICSMLEAGI